VDKAANEIASSLGLGLLKKRHVVLIISESTWREVRHSAIEEKCSVSVWILGAVLKKLKEEKENGR
jgi:hypothetical protein